ncbi:hypothetical protein VTL71DRAFT_16470 [Oculimacula yallundae]|uniref:Zn(2)-C6 fungal-type domain-containing protein n=1 Tax=Oculimacula yallundae TaxID=86028 RepID=A0ABR4CFS2_9HELO
MMEGRQRVRTGCMTCRRRRRKCDEKKPSCENCEVKGFACSYGTRLDFITQSISRQPQQPEARPRENRPYRQITFVDDVPAAAPSNQKSSDYLRRSQDNQADEPVPVPEGTSTIQAQIVQHEPIIVDSPRGRTGSPITTSAQYQHGYDQPMASSASASDMGRASKGYQDDSPRNESPYVASSSAKPLHQQAQASSMQEIELLRYYRYHLGSWLDIGNSESFFELKIMLLGSSNRCLLAAVLAFSACQKSLAHAEQQSENLESSRRYLSEAEYRLPFENESISRIAKVLLMLGDFWCLSPHNWRGVLSQETNVLHKTPLSLSLTEELDQPVFWLLLRIDLAASIVAAQLPLTPNLSVLLENHLLPKSFQFPLLQRQNAIQAHQQSLFLLARCLLLIYGDREGQSVEQTHGTLSTPHSNTSSSLSASWMSIWNDNQEWYSNRPKHVQQVLEFRGVEAEQINSESSASFPILIYSSSLALLSNAIYHISSLLLLTKRPWLPKELTGSRQSKSRNWHAHSIAGIVTSNETLDQWDPILIAGILLVAKGMTHEMQQNAMLECLEKVTNITGIKLHHEIAALKSEWNISRYVEDAVYQYD